jgi:CDP-Glycerol:Poly(glycerophosphate) glycerophosphotransferase
MESGLVAQPLRILSCVRFLVLEHHFAQDIEALRRAAGGAVELDVIPYELLRSEALRILPEEVASGLEAFASPELEGARRRYEAVFREILEDRFTSKPFDAVVMPSDTFFYVRSAPAAAHALGVPFLVAQKETTISEQALSEHAERIRRFAPPLADRMTVCSERHKRFWIRAGAAEERILVTGQPRFDFYSHRSGWPVEAVREQGPSVLFLSYAVDAYHPGEGRGEAAWSALHRQTERGLFELARRGWRVLIKPHPQQQLDSLRRWRREAADLWERRIFVVDAQADVRPLIVAADAVVGFQSTALLEAMLVGRPVLYTAWDQAAEALEDRLIPFHRWEREIAVIRKAEDLPAAVVAARGNACSADVVRSRREIAERYLGPLDGQAAQRTLAALSEEAALWEARRGAPERELRARLAARRTPLRMARRGRAWARVTRRRVGAMLGR